MKIRHSCVTVLAYRVLSPRSGRAPSLGFPPDNLNLCKFAFSEEIVGTFRKPFHLNAVQARPLVDEYTIVYSSLKANVKTNFPLKERFNTYPRLIECVQELPLAKIKIKVQNFSSVN